MTRRPASRSSRRPRRRWYTWALAVGMTAAVGVVTVASAAHLPVFGPRGTVDHAVPCTDLTLSASVGGSGWHGAYSAVSVTGIPSTCYNLDAELVVYGTGGVQLATGSGPTGPTGTATFPTGTFTGSQVQGVALLIDTWGIRTTWTSVPTTPAISCIALNPGGQPWNRPCSVSITGSSGVYPNSVPPGGEMMNFTFNVTTTGAHWRVTIDFTHPDFAWVPVWVGQYSNEVEKAPGYTCPNPVTTLVIQDDTAFWGATLYIGENGPPTWWGGQTLCP